MIKYAEVENGDAVICVTHEQCDFTALVLANPLDIDIWHF